MARARIFRSGFSPCSGHLLPTYRPAQIVCCRLKAAFFVLKGNHHDRSSP